MNGGGKKLVEKEHGVKRILKLMAVAVFLLAPVSSLYAAPLRVRLAEFKVTGAANRDELRGSLQALLASRLEGGELQVVDAGEKADLDVAGTYILFGKVFSLDARVSSSGKVVARAFEQGESADDTIPAMGRLAQKLLQEIGKYAAKGGEASGAAVAVRGVQESKGEVIRPEPAAAKNAEGDIIRAERSVRAEGSGMIGQRLEGDLLGMALIRRIDAEQREIVVADQKEIRLYLQGKELRLLAAEKGFGEDENIIGIDSADLDSDGTAELYVTALRGSELSSRVYLVEKGGLRKIASDLPYYFRAITIKGAERKVLAQQMGRDEDFFGDLYEVAKKGSGFTIVNPVRLPRFANLFNTNIIPAKGGGELFVVLHPDGYLLVYDRKGENLWRGSDKFGGSETYFHREDSQNMRVTGSQYRKRFIEQRLTVTASGEVIVPRNEGSFVMGNSRSFNKSSVYAFAWNGAALEELWHTKVSQNYLADYAYDQESRELILLEVVKKEGLGEKGASAIAVKRVE